MLRVERDLFPCIAMQVPLLRTMDTYQAVISVGCVPYVSALGAIKEASSLQNAYAELDLVRQWWQRLCAGDAVRTDSIALDHYLNGFGLYQVIGCRLFARTSLYQNGGAYGFRDQLQDAYNLLAAPPDDLRYQLVRTQILRSCAHQYEEGDVMHWWALDGRWTWERGSN